MAQFKNLLLLLIISVTVKICWSQAQPTDGVVDNPCLLLPNSGSCDKPSSSSSKLDPVNVVNVNVTTRTVEWTAAKQLRYYYSSVNYKCAPFPYSGCGGNANNFLTFEDCKAKCDRQIEDIVKIKGALNSTKCWYKNKLYGVGDPISETRDDNACSVGCFCAEGSSGPKITCAAVDCAPPPPNRENCVPIYKQNTCCPTDYTCPPPSSLAGGGGGEKKNETEREAETPFKCKFQGVDYLEGQQIYPDQYPCHTCTCNRNFTGEIGTGFCREVNCGIAIHYQSELVNQCEPQYYVTDTGKTLCCPIMWDCPNQKQQLEEE